MDKITLKRSGLMLLLIAICTSALWAQNTQWRGLERDGIYQDKGLLKQWPDKGPELLLKKEGLGSGFSTPILYEGDIYITGKRDSVDVITKVDLQGKILWETVYGFAWKNTFPDSRNTPTIEDGRIYIMGGMGTVACIDTESGDFVWKVNTHEEFEGEFHRWGMAESLLLTDKAVISSPTGNRTSVVALDKTDGSLLWEAKSRGGARAYASPLLIDHNSREMILITSSKDLIAVDPANGKLIWSFDLVKDYTVKGRRISANTPLYHQGSIFISSGYNDQAIMLELSQDGSSVKPKWSDATLDSHHGGMVLLDGYIYGSNWINNGNGNWVCQNWQTGEVMYEDKWHNKGAIIYADGLFYVYTEKQGHVGLVEPTTEEFRVISSFRIQGGAGPHWAHPAIYDKKLLIRHGTVLFVYNIDKEE